MLVNKLPHIMASQGVSIRQLSRETGITYTTIRAVYHSERRSIQLEVLEEICRVLAVQPGDIYQVEMAQVKEQAYIEPPSGRASQTEGAIGRVTGSSIANADWRQW